MIDRRGPHLARQRQHEGNGWFHGRERYVPQGEGGQAMPVLVQVCAVIVTISMLVLAVAVVRMAGRVSKVTDETRLWLEEMRQVAGEAKQVVASAREMLKPVQRVIDRFERLGTRTAAVSAAILEEVEAPVRTAVALVRGVKRGTALFVERLGNRFKPGRAATDGGIRYE
jgi:uncharacterized protein YoxC